MSISAGMQPVGFEPHMLEKDKPADGVLVRSWGLLARIDPSVTFEEYQYWAKIEREEEREANAQYVAERGPLSIASVLKNRFSKGVHHEEKKKKKAEEARVLELQAEGMERKGSVSLGVMGEGAGPVSDEEWKTAARALRTASWGTIFYLITTDILGWSSTP